MTSSQNRAAASVSFAEARQHALREAGDLTPRAPSGPRASLLELAFQRHPWFADPRDEELSLALRRLNIPSFTPPPGQHLLVGVVGAGGGPPVPCVLVACVSDEPRGERVQWNDGSVRAWDAAVTAASSSAAILPRSPEPLRDRLPWIEAILDVPGRMRPALDGYSFGLAFGLMALSWASGLPLPADAVALAALDRDGATGVVSGLPTKLEGIMKHAPSARRVLVASAAADEARRAALLARDSRGTVERNGAVAEPAPLEVVEVDSLRDAARLVWPDFSDRVAELWLHHPDRRENVDRVFRLALGARRGMLTWAPILSFAEHILNDPSARASLSDETIIRLRFAAAVAARHEGNHEAATRHFPAPDDPLLVRGLARGPRKDIRAHALQHLADTGMPESADRDWYPDDNPVVASGLDRDPLDFEPADLKIAGAWARHLHLAGRSRESLQLQLRVAERWIANLSEEESSHAICSAFIVSGALGDAVAWRTARELWARAEVHFDAISLAYTRLARGRAFAMFGDPNSAKRDLQAAAESRFRDVASSARRWLIRLARGGVPIEVPPQPPAHRPGVFDALTTLDAALASGDEDGVRSAAASVSAAEPLSPFDRLVASGVPEGIERSVWQWAADAYPY